MEDRRRDDFLLQRGHLRMILESLLQMFVPPLP